MTDFAINGNNALQQTNETLYRKVVVNGKEQFVEVPIGKPETQTTTTKAAEKELKFFEENQEKAILSARKHLNNSNKDIRKGAEEVLLQIYQDAFVEEGKTEKEAKKLAKLALKEDQAALRFEKRQVFVDKEEYEKARKADKENKDNYEYLSKKTRKFVEANQEKFYENGEFKSEKFKAFMKGIANEDHQADLFELDKAAEDYNTKRRTMGKAAKQAGLDKETDHTVGKRLLHVAKHTAIGTASGAAIGAATGYLTGTKIDLKDVNHKHIDVDSPDFTVDVDNTCNLDGKIDTRKSQARSGAIGGAIAGGISGLTSGLLTMKKVKDNGEGEYTKRENATTIIQGKFKKPEPPAPVVEPKCSEEIIDKPIIEEVDDKDYCEYTPKKGECWSDVVRDKYGIKNGGKELRDAVHKLKDYHGVKYSENVQPKVLKLYNNLEVGDKVYQLDCDADVEGTVTRYAKQQQYNGTFQHRKVKKQTGTEYTYNRYSETKDNKTLVDTQKFTDSQKLEEYIKENGCK